MALLEFKEKGIYCPQADIYIDPWRPVDKALITHGHSDHARWGHKRYISTHQALPVIKYRLGDINIMGVDYGQKLSINGVKFSFHPAGHIPGSAQIRVEYQGEIWVASGDYKVVDDGVAEAWEPVRCHSFITESTFGLPIFNWKDSSSIMSEINEWWASNIQKGKLSILSAYSLGKAQRIINNIDHNLGSVYTHSAVENTNEILRSQGYDILPTTRLDASIDLKSISPGIIIAPPAAVNSKKLLAHKAKSIAFASGWMAMRGTRRRRAADRGFVLSDHADWKGLNSAIKATGAENIFVTHGYTDSFTRWLRDQGYNAHVVSTEYTGEEVDANEDAA